MYRLLVNLDDFSNYISRQIVSRDTVGGPLHPLPAARAGQLCPLVAHSLQAFGAVAVLPGLLGVAGWTHSEYR